MSLTGRCKRLMALAAVAAVSVAGLSVPARAQTVTILETGSSLLYPLFNLWVPAYRQQNPNVQITSQSTGSGTGISEAISGLAQIGASDAYLSNALMKRNPGMLNIPLAISSQMVAYNLLRLNGDHLKLSGPVLAGIYDGTIKDWDDPRIANLNPGAKLPGHAIITIHRTDGSGDTFIFTQYLSFSTPGWQDSISYGTTVSWPAAPGAIGANGNQGMLTALKGNAYAIAYIGISFGKAVADARLGEATLQNRDGRFVLPDPQTVQAAAAAKVKETPPDGRISLIFAPGADSYPLVNYEYAIVKQQQRDAPTAQALRRFLGWAVSPDGGNAPHFMEEVNFVALPPPVADLSKAQIARIGTAQAAGK